jgi:hypothetical protein
MCREATIMLCRVMNEKNPAISENPTTRAAYSRRLSESRVRASSPDLRASIARPMKRGCATVKTLLSTTASTPHEMSRRYRFRYGRRRRSDFTGSAYDLEAGV